jgi:hypothetical protein
MHIPQAGRLMERDTAALAAVVIDEAVRELGVHFRGNEGSALLFERASESDPARQTRNVIAADVRHVLYRLREESEPVREFLAEIDANRIRII